MNYENSMKLLEKIIKKKKFSNFINEQRIKSEINLDIFSLLIVPVQRPPRYVLLLEELIKNTNEKNRDYRGLLSAAQKISKKIIYIYIFIFIFIFIYFYLFIFIFVYFYLFLFIFIYFYLFIFIYIYFYLFYSFYIYFIFNLFYLFILFLIYFI